MPNAIKFTEEEMLQINNVQQSYINLQNALGQVSVNRIRLNQQFDDLETSEDSIKTQFIETQTIEKNFVEQINKKYGDGNLDLTTGEFIPKPTEEKTDKTL